MKTKQVISRLIGTDKSQKSKNTSMLKEIDIPFVSQSVRKANKNEHEIKKEKDAAFISKRLDSIFEYCRKVPLSVKRILKGKATFASDYTCIFSKIGNIKSMIQLFNVTTSDEL